MKAQTHQLTGEALNWAATWADHGHRPVSPISYDTGGILLIQLMERERISVIETNDEWLAYQSKGLSFVSGRFAHGTTIAEAVLRCFVLRKLGPEIDVPPEVL